jgi:hypothetical protein
VKHAKTWKNLENILGKISQTQKENRRQWANPQTKITLEFTKDHERSKNNQ